MYFVKGALEKVLKQCTKFSNGNEKVLLSGKKEQEIFTEAYEIGRKGLRGLLCYYCIYQIIFFVFNIYEFI